MSDEEGLTAQDFEVVCAVCGSWGVIRGWNETHWQIDHAKQNVPCEVPR